MCNTSKEQENFEYWLANMDDFLIEFFNTIPKSLATKLDYSPQSLSALEEFILDRYDVIGDIKKKKQTSMLNGLSIYLGETFRKNLGGQWDIELDDEEDADYGVPILVGLGKDQETIAPIYLITACIDRRKGNYLSHIYTLNKS